LQLETEHGKGVLMSNYDREQREMDAVERDLELGLRFEVVGWMLLLFNGIAVMFLWVGLRSGSFLWAYWAVIEGFVGFVLIMIGQRYKAKAGTNVSRTEEEEKAA
jgi:hypothetical protein